jgi:DNA-binding SARP family transcriptional activator
VNAHLLKTALEFRVLGPFVVHAGRHAVELGGLKPRMLLALLLLRPNERISISQLVDSLWGEKPPASARNALQVYVSRIRKAISAERVVATGGGYRLHVAPGELDLAQFRGLVDRGRRARLAGNLEVASATLREALELWRGPALEDLRANDALEAEALRIEDERLSAFEERVDADLDLGRHRELVPELEALAEEAPLRERLIGQSMLALYRSGRQADALRVFGVARRRLVDELGIEPGPELRELQRAILSPRTRPWPLRLSRPRRLRSGRAAGRRGAGSRFSSYVSHCRPSSIPSWRSRCSIGPAPRSGRCSTVFRRSSTRVDRTR